jgi:hypothetical protein
LGHLDNPPEVAIFADTQEEPAAVYRHLDWLEANFAQRIPIWRKTIGKLGDDLSRGIHSTGQRVASIPAFTTALEGRKDGQTRRQPITEAGSGRVQEKQKAFLEEIIKKVNELFEGERLPLITLLT